ncbi:helix-turn-helix domain-containing protein (plasmid) [Chryseobacterium panacisoli]|uniref:Helix-turn-helix domain-containing protein n=1 Tax=Chryseobacterium panacisoli TaxID=1807141 RepID=A0A5D8ZWM1_9FLAO|nr:helix-turn-helix domain-containing protein [Chryseobacterium panacisoli]TZF99365.1 helix-turn-helix domain-containing protein [Chryseobacterium panacisoli]
MSTNIHILKTCEYCGLEFEAKTTVTKFCCQRCRTKMYKKHNKNLFPTKENKTLCYYTPTYSPFEHLTIKEASNLIGCAPGTIYDMIKKGRLAYINFSQRKTRVFREEIEQILYRSKTGLQPFIFRDENTKVKNCWTINEIINLYKISASALYNKLKAYNIIKIRKGKSVYVSKEIIRRLFKPVI